MRPRQPSRFHSRLRVARGEAGSRDSSDRIAPGNQESAQPCPAPHWPARWKPIEVASLLPRTVRQRSATAPRAPLEEPKSLSFLALDDLQDLIGLNVLQNLNPSAGPAQLNFFDSCITAQPKMDALIRGTSETPRSGYMVVLHQAGFSCDFDARANSVSVAFDANRLKQNPMVVVRCGVVEQLGTITNGGYNHINLAVVIEIAERTPTMSGTNLHIRTGFRAFINECSILDILEHGICLLVVLLRVVIGVLTNVRVGGEKILKTIVIEVIDAIAPTAHL